LPFALWQFRVPGPGESLQLLGVAITTFLGQYYMIQAYQKDVVSRVAIIGYLGPALAVAYGFVLFHEIPTLGGLAGLALIVLSVSLSTRRAWGRKT
jgi:drug/metabolite transporter (DMT)-like permease